MDTYEYRRQHLNNHRKRFQSNVEMATHAGIDSSYLGALLQGKNDKDDKKGRNIGPKIARSLEAAFGDNPGSWDLPLGHEPTNLTTEEQELLTAFRRVDDRGKRRILGTARSEVAELASEPKHSGESRAGIITTAD